MTSRHNYYNLKNSFFFLVYKINYFIEKIIVIRYLHGYYYYM